MHDWKHFSKDILYVFICLSESSFSPCSIKNSKHGTLVEATSNAKFIYQLHEKYKKTSKWKLNMDSWGVAYVVINRSKKRTFGPNTRAEPKGPLAHEK